MPTPSSELICTICARGGSKGVKNKNIRMLAGKPLVAHTVEQAKSSGLFSYVAVSSDSQDILSIAQEFGADFLIDRPAGMASDTSGKLPAIRHCFLEVERLTGKTYRHTFDLDATSPLRIQQDLVEVQKLLMQDGVDNVITGAPARRSPYFNLVERSPDGHVALSKPPEEAVLRRQDSPECFDMNGSIYAWTRRALLEEETLFSGNVALHVMPEERSQDIDTEFDFKIVELMMNERAGQL